MGGRFRTGESGNPSGKPPGSGKIEPLRAAIRDHAPEIIAAMVEAAKGGDVGAAKLLLERTLPPVKPVQEPAPVALEGATLTEKAGSVLDVVGRGKPQAGCPCRTPRHCWKPWRPSPRLQRWTN